MQARSKVWWFLALVPSLGCGTGDRFVEHEPDAGGERVVVVPPGSSGISASPIPSNGPVAAGSAPDVSESGPGIDVSVPTPPSSEPIASSGAAMSPGSEAPTAGVPSPVRCGNGVVETGEECDGGATCSSDCNLVACGDGRVDEGEECDPPDAGICNGSCQAIACGNGRVDEGEECEPPGAPSCSASCLQVVCGDGRLDEGEQCDPPLAGACDASCGGISCGNGVVEEGEGCDPPSAGTCSEDCRPLGCGDERVDAPEECDPPVPGVCDASCRVISCGNGRVEGGEECDPPVPGRCGSGCRAIECGNGRVDEGEACDPPRVGECNAQCQAIACGDGRVDEGEQCEPTGPNDARCSSSCASIDELGTVSLFGFDSGLDGWQLYATSPERLFAGSRVEHDAQNGDKTPGVLEMFAPFDGPNQKIEVQASLQPVDMRGRILRARVRLGSGLSNDANNPGGIKLFAKSGQNYAYASGAWTWLVPGAGWVDVTLDCDAPILVPDAFDAGSVRQIGVELRAFEETTGVTSAVVYVDSLTY